MTRPTRDGDNLGQPAFESRGRRIWPERPAGEGQASVITLENFEKVPEEARGAFVAVGNFDGVHRGHAHLLARLRARADAAGVPALALTFDPPPVAVLRPDAAPVPLTRLDRRLDLMRAAGATEVGVFRTGTWLLGLTAREFFDTVILGQLEARGMVEGPTFGFGRDRGGDAALLGSWCAEAGLDFEVASPTAVDGLIVSSTRIRKALAEGDAAEAANLLGHPHRVQGKVIHGAGRGAAIGVPTANLDGIDTVVPLDGVYAALARLEGDHHPHPTALHIGPNATFGEQARTVEAHLIDFQRDLYGQTVELDLLKRLRSTRKFKGLNDLLDQIGIDIEQAREACLKY